MAGRSPMGVDLYPVCGQRTIPFTWGNVKGAGNPIMWCQQILWRRISQFFGAAAQAGSFPASTVWD
jgi:hypothetical protein